MTLNTNRIFNKGAEFWLGKYYDTSKICPPSNDISQQFGEFIVEKFKQNSIKTELCTLIDMSFSENFESFSETETTNDKINCFVDGPIFYDKKFRYIRLPNFKSEMLKNFELKISINPCLANSNAMTKVYCNSILHESMDKKTCVDFYGRSQILCDTVNKYITKIYARNFNTFVKNNPVINSYMREEESFSKSFTLTSTVIGSDDKKTKDFIKSMSPNTNEKTNSKESLKFFIKLLKNTNDKINNHFNLNDYHWKVINSSPKNNYQHGTNAILGYAENNTDGHLIGISDNTPRKILLPLHVKFIIEN